MTTDPLLAPVRDVLGRTGDLALPARSWADVVAVPFEDRSDGDHRTRWLAAAAVIVVLLGAAGVWQMRTGSGTEVFATPPGTARWIAVPLFVSEGMAYDGTIDGDGTVPGYDGVAAADTVVVSWTRGDDTLTIVSAEDPGGLSALPGRDEPLVPLQTATVVEDDGPIVLRWYSPTGSTGAFGLRAVGLTLDEALTVARSAWYVTPDIWFDLSARAGFRSPDELMAPMDPWAPPGIALEDDAPVAFVRGSVQRDVVLGGLSVSFLGGTIGLFEAATAIDRCSAVADGDNGVAQPVALFGNADVAAFVVTDADGTVRRVPALEHPGLPNYRFAVTMATPENGVLPVTCETLP